MEDPYSTSSNGEAANSNLQIIRYSPFQPCNKFSSSWFDLRVFYVRISNVQVDASTPEFLTLNHIPLSPDTLLELNGVRSSMYSDGVSSFLRRDRVDKKSEEATFVSTDSIRTTGSVKFEVFDKEDLILSGVLEMSNTNGFVGESKGNVKRWSMNCEPEITAGSGFLRGKHNAGTELPTIEIYVTGCFLGTPIILTKTLQLSYRKKHIRKGMLDSIPEYETTESPKNVSPKHDLQILTEWTAVQRLVPLVSQSSPRPSWDYIVATSVLELVGWLLILEEFIVIQIADYRSYKLENEEDYSNMNWRSGYMEGEDGELSWFNAGVRVGVGIGLGICLGVGVGVGLLVRTYQATTRNFKRRLL